MICKLESEANEFFLGLEGLRFEILMRVSSDFFFNW